MSIAEIAAKLRERGEWSHGGKVWEADWLCQTAAEELERLKMELDHAQAALRGTIAVATAHRNQGRI